eukprot:3716719-Alexandrium_andersonii.AAC.1
MGAHDATGSASVPCESRHGCTRCGCARVAPLSALRADCALRRASQGSPKLRKRAGSGPRP